VCTALITRKQKLVQTRFYQPYSLAEQQPCAFAQSCTLRDLQTLYKCFNNQICNFPLRVRARGARRPTSQHDHQNWRTYRMLPRKYTGSIQRALSICQFSASMPQPLDPVTAFTPHQCPPLSAHLNPTSTKSLLNQAALDHPFEWPPPSVELLCFCISISRI
jgi:hypothetical protein